MAGADYGLHPLIHISLGFAQAQDVERKKAEPRIPHLLSLNQDIVAWSQEEKCALKYVIHILARPSHSGDLGVGQYLVEN